MIGSDVWDVVYMQVHHKLFSKTFLAQRKIKT